MTPGCCAATVASFAASFNMSGVGAVISAGTAARAGGWAVGAAGGAGGVPVAVEGAAWPPASSPAVERDPKTPPAMAPLLPASLLLKPPCAVPMRGRWENACRGEGAVGVGPPDACWPGWGGCDMRRCGLRGNCGGSAAAAAPPCGSIASCKGLSPCMPGSNVNAGPAMAWPAAAKSSNAFPRSDKAAPAPTARICWARLAGMAEYVNCPGPGLGAGPGIPEPGPGPPGMLTPLKPLDEPTCPVEAPASMACKAARDA